MALNSADVSAGDTATAAQYNNLRSDVQEHTHEGADTTKVKAESLDVTTGNVPTNGVGTASIEDAAVTLAKLNADAINEMYAIALVFGGI